jgi:hypothetical protein
MATTINTLFSLTRLSGTDPLSIRLGPNISTADPTGSGSIVTTTITDETIIETSVTVDTYILITNTGGTTSGNVLITNGPGTSNIALLKPTDFLFMPLKGSTGAKIKYDTATTTLEWFYWTRG